MKLHLDKSLLPSSIFIGVVLSFPITGFIYGFCICSDCGTGIDSIGARSFLGGIFTVMNTVLLGFIMGDNEARSLHLYVLLTAIPISSIIYWIKYHLKNRVKYKAVKPKK